MQIHNTIARLCSAYRYLHVTQTMTTALLVEIRRARQQDDKNANTTVNIAMKIYIDNMS